ncbi:HAMP domain-containing sensor histidine kinase [Chryseobacterium sp. MYb264]|uniref:sensor histidine kinase n=1 Tax=Chryseobacterium sp. MYb264 TaxID=2745153 RepID=UPI002E150DB9|nr:HAMP domain-containing sensor histidine kinase [Chryseobacterium sp. MYb264]
MHEKIATLKKISFRIVFFLMFMSQGLLSQSTDSKWYTMDNGLPQNSVKDIIKDKYGIMWLSTENGIVKYDGNKFEVYNNFPLKNLNFEYFRGNAQNDSLILFNASDIHPILIKKRQAKISYSKAIRAPFYFSNSGYGIINKNYFFNGTPSYIQNYGIHFKHSKYYFSSNKITVSFQDDKQKEVKMPSEFDHLKAMSHMFGYNEHLFVINKKEKKIIDLYKGNVSQSKNGSSLIYDKNSKLYWQQSTNQTFVILNNKIYRVFYKNNVIETQFVTQYDTFDTDQIVSIFYDEQYKKLYLGSSTKGLKILSVDRFYTSLDHSKYADNVYYASLPFGKNSVITEGGKIYDKFGVVGYKKFHKKPYKRFITYHSNFNIVYSNYSAIIRHLKSTNYQKHDSISINRVLTVSNIIGNKIVAAHYHDLKTNFFCIYDENGKKEFEMKMNIDESPATIEKFDPGFYLLANSKNLFWFSIAKKQITLTLSFNICLKQIMKLGKDLYLLTTFKNGLYILKNKKLIKLPLDAKKNLSTAHFALEDPNGNFWISSNNGLFKIRKKNILEFVENKRKDLFYYSYTKEDGLINNEFNGTSFPCANMLESGEFVFPSMEGFVFFKPNDVPSNYPSSKDLYLERARSENKIVEFKNKLLLPSDYKNSEILVDVPYYGNLENINLEYKIDDNDWKKVNGKAINLAGLSHGSHDLAVRMLISDNGNFTSKKITIEVEPKFHQTIWFRFLIISCLILLILFIVYSRTKRLKSKNEILKKTVIKKAKELDESLKNLHENQKQLSDRSEYEKKIIENIIHDITTPVRFIALISQQLSDATDPETQKEYFESLHASSEQLHKYTLNLKDYTQIYKEDKHYEDEYYSLADFVNEKRLLFHEIALHNNTIIINKIDSNITINIKKSFMNMILHNLMDNAVKNTFDGYITIFGSSNSDQEVTIEIKDTGIGMSDADNTYYNNLFNINGKLSDPKYKSSLGLYLVSQVSKKINLNINFEKNQPKGTIVKLVLRNTDEQEDYNS